MQQALLHGGHVVDALGHHPRELLQAGVAVELERIEVGVLGAGLGDARLHLHLGLDLDLAQLVAQADHVLGEVEQRTPQAAQLALDPAARDADLAGLVDEAVDALGAHAQSGRGEGLGLGRGLRAGAFGTGRAGERLQARLAESELVDDLLAAVDAVRERFGEHGGRLARGEAVLQARLELVQVGAEAHRARHARAALERVQQARDRTRRLLVVGLGAPAPQGGVELADGLGGLFEEDRQQLGVDVVLRLQHGAGLRRAERCGRDGGHGRRGRRERSRVRESGARPRVGREGGRRCAERRRAAGLRLAEGDELPNRRPCRERGGRGRRVGRGGDGGCGDGVGGTDRLLGAPGGLRDLLLVDGLKARDERVGRLRRASRGDLLAHRAQRVEGFAEQRQRTHPGGLTGVGEALQPVLQGAAQAMRGF